MKLKIDLHIHTHHSPDGFSSPKELVLAAKEKGFDAIAVTDHYSTKGALEAKSLARRLAPKLLVIIGQEAKTEAGDFLVYGPVKAYPKGIQLLDLVKDAKRKSAFLIAPHPFDKLRSGIGSRIMEILPDLTAIEAFNGRTYIGPYNSKASAFAKANRIPCVASSDTHHTREFGNTYTVVGARSKTPAAIFSAIRAGRAELVKERTSFTTHLRATLTKRFAAGKGAGK